MCGWSVEGSGRSWKHRRSDPALVWLRSCEDLMCLATWRPLNTMSVLRGEGLGADPGQETRDRRPGTEALGGPALRPHSHHSRQVTRRVGLCLTHSHTWTGVTWWPRPTVGVGTMLEALQGPLNNRGQTRKDQGGEVRMGAGPVGVLPWEAPAPTALSSLSISSSLFLSFSQSQALFLSSFLSFFHSLSQSLSHSLSFSFSHALLLCVSRGREGGAHLPTSRNQGNRS